MEHLQRLRVSLVSTAASKNNLGAAFVAHFMSSTYVTIHPMRVHVNIFLCGVNSSVIFTKRTSRGRADISLDGLVNEKDS